MPRSPLTTLIRLCLATLLTAPLALVACGASQEKTPTVAEAGATLRSHILQLLAEVNAKNITVTDPGRQDIPCEDGKAKRTFAASGEDFVRNSEAGGLNSQMIGALDRIASYEITDVNNLGKYDEPVEMANKSAKTVLRLQSSKPGVFVVHGRTECLSQ
jgi:hypothetical protein